MKERGSKKRLVDKGRAITMCVGYTPSMEEPTSSKREKRERNAHFPREKKRVFWHALELGKRGKRHPRLSLSWGRLDLEALGLWWSVGENGEGEAFSSFHESYEEAFCESENEK